MITCSYVHILARQLLSSFWLVSRFQTLKLVSKCDNSIKLQMMFDQPYSKIRYNAKNVNKVFAIGSRSFARGASSRSYNEFVGSRSGVNFIIPRNMLVLCKDSFIVSASRNALQMNGKLLYIVSNSQRLQSTN